MKNLIVLLVFILAFACTPKAQSQNVEVLKVEQYSSKMNEEGVQLLDVRTPKEYAEGHIGEAKNINVLEAETFKKEIATLDKTKPVMVYCKSGKRSQKASQILEEEGFEVIYDLQGGYKAWQSKH